MPVFKETVEVLFAAGLVKVVYATETLALGINMPARSVVLEQLEKWNGTAHAALTPGEYTQLTGRAGRRGIDVEGHAIVLYRQDVDPGSLAGLASRRTYPLRSSFHPTYNMAVNLLGALPYSQAREILESSFAQFQADRGVVGLARQARRNEEALAGYAEAMTCHLGDFKEYARLRRRIGLHVSSDRLGAPVLRVLTPEPRVRTLSPEELPHGAATVATVPVPKHANLRDARERRDLAARLRSAVQAAPPAPTAADERRARTGTQEEIESLRRQLRAHPCHGCSDREEHARWANRWATLDAEHQRLLRRIENRTSSIARDFDRVCALLTQLGYLEQEGEAMVDPLTVAEEDAPVAVPELLVTDNGRWLARLYAEKDLVLAECLRRGLWSGLDAAQLAAVVSTVVYSARTDAASAPSGAGGGALGEAVRATVRVSDELAELESQYGVQRNEPVDAGIVNAVHQWARGAALDTVLDGTELGAGDFVRWCKQVLDVLDQLATAAPDPEGRRTARRAIDLVRRGVVAWSSV